nr:hypothetical protein [Clostridium tyrobutyricum]
MIDGTFSINYSAEIPEEVDNGYFMFFVTVLNYFAWVIGVLAGAFFGWVSEFDLHGVEFVMTALFLSMFVIQ